MNFSGPEIAQKIKLGDGPAFERLYSFFCPKLAYFSNQYLMDPEAANNVAQDVFTELWAHRQSLQDDTNIQAWLFTVAKNKSLKQISREQSKQRYGDYLKARQMKINYQSLSGFDTSHFVFEELQQKVDEALSRLSPPVRAVFEKSRYEDKKNREIADELGISIKTVEAHISKALQHLRKELKEYLPLLCILFFLK
ncbi:MAG: RNA polymerase sigma-70 factor [Prolixibacteraceae bacterium]|jgi:RNA polymerase sigma-70 factor (ECF subfamily)|nr:RNA polymerase sigma-70 factor [Prolixibacteraceae bacterium]